MMPRAKNNVATRLAAPLACGERSRIAGRVERRARARAFTLLETLAAVVILGLLVSLAAWNFAAPLRRARFDQVVEQVRYLDSSTRQLARDSGRPLRLTIDLDRGTLTRLDASGTRELFRDADLPTAIRIDRVRTQSDERDGGSAQIDISPLGLSPSYAIRLAAADRRQWVFVSGLGGQVKVVSDDSQIAAIFAQTTTGGRHAD
jgi:prepilin-type N-terminal cleavage/methylation domain-containing protein